MLEVITNDCDYHIRLRGKNSNIFTLVDKETYEEIKDYKLYLKTKGYIYFCNGCFCFA